MRPATRWTTRAGGRQARPRERPAALRRRRRSSWRHAIEPLDEKPRHYAALTFRMPDPVVYEGDRRRRPRIHGCAAPVQRQGKHREIRVEIARLHVRVHIGHALVFQKVPGGVEMRTIAIDDREVRAWKQVAQDDRRSRKEPAADDGDAARWGRGR